MTDKPTFSKTLIAAISLVLFVFLTNNLNLSANSQNKPDQPALTPITIDAIKKGDAPDADLPEPKEIKDSNLIHSAIPVINSPATTNTAAGSQNPTTSTPRTNKKQEIPTITYGMPSWAVQQKRAPLKIPTSTVTPVATTNPATTITPQATALIPKVDKDGVELEQRAAEPYITLNARILVPHNHQFVDLLYAYPYPVKPPNLSTINPLPTEKKDLKNMILGAGYSDRIDFNRPYPNYGWRWVHAFYRAHDRSGLGYPHSMFTMYQWVDQMMPYVITEVKRSNDEETARMEKYARAADEFEKTHLELENQATIKGLAPIQVKLNSKGIGQTKLTPGNWWIAGTRKVPGLKIFWEVPVSLKPGQIINLQLTEANALTIQGGW